MEIETTLSLKKVFSVWNHSFDWFLSLQLKVKKGNNLREHAMNPQSSFLLILNGVAPGFVFVSLRSICSTNKKQREEQQYSAWPGCNPSTRFMNCVCLCVYFLAMVAVACVSEVIRECFQLSDMSQRREVKRRSLTPTHIQRSPAQFDPILLSSG